MVSGKELFNGRKREFGSSCTTLSRIQKVLWSITTFVLLALIFEGAIYPEISMWSD